MGHSCTTGFPKIIKSKDTIASHQTEGVSFHASPVMTNTDGHPCIANAMKVEKSLGSGLSHMPLSLQQEPPSPQGPSQGWPTDSPVIYKTFINYEPEPTTQSPPWSPELKVEGFQSH